MPQAIRLADLAALTPSEREIIVERLVKDAVGPINGSGAATIARIRAFEQRYEVSSDTLLEELRTGRRKETAEISEWLFLLQLQRQEAGAG